MPRSRVTRSASFVEVLDGAVRIERDYILSRAHFQPSDIVLVSGTLIEGIGNIHSDVDCLVLCDARPKIGEIDGRDHVMVSDADYNPNSTDSEIHNTYDYFGNAGLHIDFDYLTFSEVDALCERVLSAHKGLSNDERILYEHVLSNRDNRFIHRLRVGHPFHNAARFDDLVKSVPVEQFCYVSFREYLPNYFVFKDVQGAWIARDYWMAREIARDMLIDLLRAYLHLLGNSNKNKKWIYTSLADLPHTDAAMKERALGALLGASHGLRECQSSILACLDVMDEIYTRMPDLLRAGTLFPDPMESVEKVKREFAARTSNDHVLAREEYEYRTKPFLLGQGRPLRAMVSDWEPAVRHSRQV